MKLGGGGVRGEKKTGWEQQDLVKAESGDGQMGTWDKIQGGKEMRIERGKEMGVIWGRQVNQLKITNKISCMSTGLCEGEMDFAKWAGCVLDVNRDSRHHIYIPCA